jgi:hypothetical protein
MAIMKALNVPVLDVFELSYLYLSAHEHKPGDAIHYGYSFSNAMLSWFYSPKAAADKRRPTPQP